MRITSPCRSCCCLYLATGIQAWPHCWRAGSSGSASKPILKKRPPSPSPSASKILPGTPGHSFPYYPETIRRKVDACGCTRCSSAAAQGARLYGDRTDHTGPGNWRDHGDLYPHSPGDAEVSAGRKAGGTLENRRQEPLLQLGRLYPGGRRGFLALLVGDL